MVAESPLTLNREPLQGAAPTPAVVMLLFQARNNKTTVMHYLCQLLERSHPDALLLMEELPTLDPASSLSIDGLKAEMGAIGAGLRKAAAELKKAEGEAENSRTTVAEQSHNSRLFCIAVRCFL
eukprot:4087206-Pyramimonas_sp.AAC.1